MLTPESFEIDPNNLEKALVEQYKLYQKVIDDMAKALSLYEQAKTFKEVMNAELSMKVKQFPESYNIRRMTEAAVSSVVSIQPEFREAQSRYANEMRNVILLNLSIKSLEARIKAIELLVKLKMIGATKQDVSDLAKSMVEEEKREERTETAKRIQSPISSIIKDNDQTEVKSPNLYDALDNFLK